MFRNDNKFKWGENLAYRQLKCLMREDPCDQANRLLDDDDEVIHDDKASTIFTLFRIFLVCFLFEIVYKFLS